MKTSILQFSKCAQTRDVLLSTKNVRIINFITIFIVVRQLEDIKILTTNVIYQIRFEACFFYLNRLEASPLQTHAHVSKQIIRR